MDFKHIGQLCAMGNYLPCKQSSRPINGVLLILQKPLMTFLNTTFPPGSYYYSDLCGNHFLAFLYCFITGVHPQVLHCLVFSSLMNGI